jgi:DNA replication protein DnaC
MFNLVSESYGRASLIITSNGPFSAWGEIFGDEGRRPRCADLVISPPGG